MSMTRLINLSAILLMVVGGLAYGQQVNPNKLPPCPQPDYSKSTDIERFFKWTNCWGKYRIELSSERRGEEIEGEWVNGVLHGKGTYTYVNGDRYVGEWKQGRQHGRGIFTSANGDRQEGIWENDRFVSELLVNDTWLHDGFSDNSEAVSGLFVEVEDKSLSDPLGDAKNTCADLGFTQKTPAYGECVLEINRRQKKLASANSDTSPDSNACKKFGFTPGTEAYSNCRLQMEFARTQAKQKQAEYALAQKRYEQEIRDYNVRIAEYEQAKRRQQSDAMVRFGLSLMGGTSPHASENFANAGRASLGLPPVRPAAPQTHSFIITNTEGQISNCSIVGNLINCF
jgi:hypothetical protein